MNSMLTPRPVRSGFTLLEVLVALSIFALVLGLLYGTWKVLVQGNLAGLRLAADAHRTRMTVQTIEEALNSAVRFDRNRTYYGFSAEGADGVPQLSFAAHLASSFLGSGRFNGQKVRRVTFRVESSPGGSSVLMLYQKSILADLAPEDPGYGMPLAQDVSAFEVTFPDPRLGIEKFVPEWKNTNSLPPLVRIDIGFGQKSRFSKEPAEVVTRFIRLPSVGVAGDAQSGLRAAALPPLQ